MAADVSGNTPLADASVRRARPNDAPAVGVVQAAVFRAAYAAVLPPEVVDQFQPEAFARGWREALASPAEGINRLLVACAGPQVVGLVVLGPSQDPDGEPLWAEVGLLGVHPDGRRQGHGSRLLQAAVDQASEAGAECLTVWLPARDEGSRAFLAAAGFDPDGAYRDRIVSPDGDVLREVRLSTLLGEPAP